MLRTLLFKRHFKTFQPLLNYHQYLEQANKYPQNTQLQNILLRHLRQQNKPMEIIERVESKQFATDLESSQIYVDALNRLGRGDQALEMIRDRIQPFQNKHSGTKENPYFVVSKNAPATPRERLFNAIKFAVVLYLGLLLFMMEGLAILTTYSDELAKTSTKSFSVYNEIDPNIEKTSGTGTVTFSDVQGVDECKEELKEIVAFLKDPEKFTRLGGKLPKGVLLTGPPGTGKTLLARAVAGEANVPFFHCSGSEFDEMFVGVGAKRVRELFATAKKKAPCIIFIDEIDAMGSMRNPRDQQFAKMTLNQLLVEMDGFSQTQGIIVIGATNFPESLDKALVRPGRFDRNVVVSVPDVKGRLEILKVHTKKVPLSTSVRLQTLARATPGFSGADLANLVNQAALRAAANNQDAVTMNDLEWAKDRILMGAERKNAVISEQNRKMVAYHEAGHALVAFYTPGALPIHKATIMPRGQALGMVSQLPEDDELQWTRKQLLARIDVAMGGRCSEMLIFGPEEVSSGASSDLESATKTARAMVSRFGMSQKQELGNVLLFKNEQEYAALSSDTKRQVEVAVKEMLDQGYQRAMKVLTNKRKELELLTDALLQYETLTREEIEKVIRGEKLVRVLE